LLINSRFLLWTLLSAIIFVSNFTVSFADEICSSVMHSVYKLEGTAKNGEPIAGTCFLISGKSGNENGKFLITASHLLEQIVGDFAVLNLRKKAHKRVSKYQCKIQIRERNKKYWVNSVGSDFALLKVELPENLHISVIDRKELARDGNLSELAISPGDQVFVAGFPYGCESGADGFPILRSGIVASFMEAAPNGLKSFLVDFEVFQGYSGAPVFIKRDREKKIVGVVTDEIFMEELRLKGKKARSTKRGLGLGKATFSGELERLLSCY
jgi:hypothetical protein